MITKYYYIYINHLIYDDIDMEILASRVECFNSKVQSIILDSLYSSSDTFCFGKIRLIYISKIDSIQKSTEEELKELANLLETSITLEPIEINQMTAAQLSSIKIAKKMMLGDDYICGIHKVKWIIKSKAEVCENVNSLIGFEDFKLFFKKLCAYIDNVKKSISKGNYNIVLINNCGADEEMFIKIIYELYISLGVVMDMSIISGDLDDALRTQKDTPFLYEVNENWNFGGNENRLSITNVEGSFRKLGKRETIYITTMDKVQYERAKDISSFTTFFIHTVEINDLNQIEKLGYVEQCAKRLGFAINLDNLENCYLLNLSLSMIEAKISEVVKRKLTEDCRECFQLSFEDFSDTEAPLEKIDPFLKLEAMIGLGEVKERVREISSYLDRKGRDSMPCLHMVFRGNPGTGKTTVARLLGEIFAESGIIKRRDVFVETDREGLVGIYVGQTSPKTSAKIKEAMGGILFIDEAYSLGCSKEGYDYGQEAISTLVKRMEDYRHDFVCIMAGYPNEMNSMLSINPGLHDRIQFYIDFPDYTAEELRQIFCKMCTDEKYILSSATQKTIMEYFQQIISCKDTDFSNARLVRKIFERVRMRQALRTSTNKISKRDIEAVFAEKDIAVLIAKDKNTLRIGF